MQDANNDEGRRTNDVRLLVHPSHPVDRMFPSVSEIRSLCTKSRGREGPLVLIVRRDDLLRGRVGRMEIVPICYHRVIRHFGCNVTRV